MMMKSNWDSIDMILRCSFPKKEGWTMHQDFELGDFEVDYVFVKEQTEMVFVLYMDGVYVQKDDVKLAKGVLTESQNFRQNHNIKVIMVYGKLLFAPEKLPPNVTVWSASVDDVAVSDRLTSVPNLN